jgi:hypothetical protein
MKSFRSFMLTEAYSRDKTLSNWKDKLDARANTPMELGYTSVTPDHLGRHQSRTITPTSHSWDDHYQAWKENPEAYTARWDHSHILGHIGSVQTSDVVGHQTSGFHGMDLDRPIKESESFQKLKRVEHDGVDHQEKHGVISPDAATTYHAELDHQDKHTRFKFQQHQDGLTNREAEMTPREYAHHKFMSDLESALPHPKYVQTALRMFTNPQGGITRTEDMFSTVADAFHRYHEIASKGKLLPDARVNLPIGTSKEEIGAHTSANWEWANRNEMVGTQDLKTGKLVTQEEVDGLKKKAERGYPLHSEFQRFDKLPHLASVVTHPKYKRILEPVPEVSDAKEGVDYEKVHEDDHQTVYHPKTEHGAWVLAHDPHTGEKADWCTAPDPKNRNAHNYFSTYHAQGPMLIVHKNHEPGIFQIHTASDQWMNQYDHNVDDEENAETDERGAGIRMSNGFSHHRATGWSNERIVHHTEDHPQWHEGDGRLHSSTGLDQHIMWKLYNGARGGKGPEYDEYTKFLPHLTKSNDLENDVPNKAHHMLTNIIADHSQPIGPKTKAAILDHHSSISLADHQLAMISRPDTTDGDVYTAMANISVKPEYVAKKYPIAHARMQAQLAKLRGSSGPNTDNA